MAENILRNLEKELGVKHTNITREQIQAAYALNLSFLRTCSVFSGILSETILYHDLSKCIVSKSVSLSIGFGTFTDICKRSLGISSMMVN